jgi:hypothetical protein
MAGRVAQLTVAVFAVCFARSAEAQNPLRAEQYKALKGLPEVSVVIHQPNSSDSTTRAITELGLEPKVVGSLTRIALAKAAPNMRLSDEFDNAKPYLEIGWYGNGSAVSLALNVWRWVTVSETGEKVFAVAWRDEALLINPVRSGVRDKLDDLLTALAADYLRANR